MAVRIKGRGLRSEPERFQISTNDFNRTKRLNDSEGKVFATSFTSGVKKVIEFFREAFNRKIEDDAI